MGSTGWLARLPRGPAFGLNFAKVAQEKLIETSGIPYTIIRSTQFLEFLGGIAALSTDGNMVRLSPGLFQPIAADDVAAIVADVALAAPRHPPCAGPIRADGGGRISVKSTPGRNRRRHPSYFAGRAASGRNAIAAMAHLAAHPHLGHSRRDRCVCARGLLCARSYRGENPAPGKDAHGELDPTPGITERPRTNGLAHLVYRVGDRQRSFGVNPR